MDYLNYPNLLLLPHLQYELRIRELETEGDISTLRARLQQAVAGGVSPKSEVLNMLDVESEMSEVAEDVKVLKLLDREYESDPGLARDKLISVRFQHNLRRLKNCLSAATPEQTTKLNAEIVKIADLLESFDRRVRHKEETLAAFANLSISSVAPSFSAYRPNNFTSTSAPSTNPLNALRSVFSPAVSRPGASTFVAPPRFSTFGPFASTSQPEVTYPQVTSSYVPATASYSYSQEGFARAFRGFGEHAGSTNYPGVNPSTDFASFLGHEQPLYSSAPPHMFISSSSDPYSQRRSHLGETSWLRNSKVYSKLPNPMTRLLASLPETDGLDPEKLVAFLKSVLKIRDKIGSVDVDILEGILPITSPPLSYCVTQGLNAGGNFDAFHQAALGLLPALMGRRLKHTLVDRLQKDGESFADFVQDICLMARVVRDPRSEPELVNIVVSNMHPEQGAYFTFQNHPQTFVDLLRLAQIAQDRMFAESQRRNLSSSFKPSFVARPNLAQPPNRRVVNHVEEPAAITEPTPEICQVTPEVPKPSYQAKPSYNNRSPGPRHCYTCGLKGHISRDCPKRVDPKN